MLSLSLQVKDAIAMTIAANTIAKNIMSLVFKKLPFVKTVAETVVAMYESCEF